MLAMQLQVGLCDAVRVGHIVVYGRSSPSVRAGTVFPRPADRGVNRHICNVDALWHQFSCHALCEPGLGMTCHCKGATRWESFVRRARVREDNRSVRAVGTHFVFAHKLSCPLTYQKRAERRVPKCLDHHAWVGFG